MALWGFLVLLSTLPAFAETALERLCFNSQNEARNAIPILNTVLIKGQDEIQPEGECLNVLVDSKRAEVFDRWVSSRLPHATRAFSTINAPVQHCDMTLVKRTSRNTVNTAIGANQQVISASQAEDNLNNEETSILKVISGKSARLAAGENDLELTCTKKQNDRFQLKFSTKPTPVTIPNIYDPSRPIPIPPPSAQTLVTEIEVGPGQEVDLGQIVRDLNKESSTISAEPAAQIKRTEGEETVTWILKVL
jgi:hypothetical protein